MKHLILIIIFINFSPLLKSTENINITESITFLNQPTSLPEQYYDKLEINTNLPKMLNSFLDRKALVRTEVPLSLWQNIKNSIDYDSFKTQIVNIIPNFYTDSELQEILNAHSDRPKVPITKINFRQELAIKSQNFIDNEFLNTVNTMLSSNGYSPISF
jgi:hypothetical protein